MVKLYAFICTGISSAARRLTLLVSFLIVSFLPESGLYAQSVFFNREHGPFLAPSSISPVHESNDNLDLLPPVITYTALPDICATGNRTLTATITDADGVPTSGSGLPVLYFRINTGPWNAVTGVSIGSNQYTFTFGGAAIQGNIVSYYIVAQDNAATPNVGAQPSAGAGGFTADPPAAATAPTNPSFYVIQATLAAGTYLVGSGQVYQTITDAVNAYNNSCLSGPVVFALTDAAGYGPSEVFPITIYNPSASSTNTLLIKPNAGVNTTITGNSSEALFKLYGADYVTIDGSNAGTTSRNLTITNTGTSTFSSVIWIGSQSSSNGATNNVVRNCRLAGNSGLTAGAITYAGIISCSGASIGFPSDAANSNNLYRNNIVEKVYVGIHLLGPTGNDSGTQIDKNSIGSTIATNQLGYRGIWANNQASLTISSNTVFNITSSLGTGSDTDPTAGIILTGAMSTANVYSNNVNTIRNTNATGWQSFGIALQSTSAASSVRVYNNFIYGITGNGKSTDPYANGHGIGVLTGGGYGIYHNSVHLVVNQNTAGISSCLYVHSGITGIAVLDVRNNIFSNRQTTGSRYSVYSVAPNTAYSQIDYNCYYSAQRVGFLVANQANLAAWQAATGSDLNSNVTNPIFTSNTDLHLQLISPMNDIGVPISGITTDFDLVDVRGVTNTDIGADEIFPPACSASNPGTVTSNRSTLCFNGSVLLTSTGFSFGLGMSYQWESSPDGVSYSPVGGETNPTSGTPPSISTTTYYRLRVACSFAGGTPAYSNVVPVTVQTPSIVNTTPGSRCGTGTVNLAATPSAGTSINWYSTLNGGDPLATGNTYTTPVISANTTYYAEAAFPGSNGTVGATSPAAQGGTISTQFTSWQVYFNVLQPTTLLSVDVYPIASNEASTITIHRSDNTVVASIPYVTTVSGGATAQVVPINVNLDAGVGYYLYTANSENGLPPSGLTRNISGAVYPYSSSDIEITGNGFNNTFYMCYYRWRFSNACATSPRTAVTASITSAASLSLTAGTTTLCTGSSTTLNASSSNSSFAYVWTPGNINGASITVSPTASTKYIVTATDGSCTSKDSITVDVVTAPSDVTSLPINSTKCSTDAAELLTASGGITGVTVLSENFNGSGLPAGWSQVNGGASAAKHWTQRADGYVPSGYSIFHTNDNSPFFLSWSGGGSTATLTQRLVSPSFNTTGLTNASLMFWHHYGHFCNGPVPTCNPANVDSIAVEAATASGGPWTKLRTWQGPLSVGSSNNFKKDTIVLPAAFLNKPTVFLRFSYVSKDNFGWAIDNITVTGNDQQMPITWTPTTGLFTDAGATTAYTGGNTFTVYAKPGTTTTYVATATGVNGCNKTDTTVITIRPAVTATISGSTAVCPLGAATISIALTGTAPWSLTYTDGTTPVTVNNINTSPYTFVVNPAATTSYSLTALSDAFCTAPPAAYAGSATVTVNPSLFSTWLGTSTDWSDAANWCGGVPSSSNLKDVVIPGSLAFYPVITDNVPYTKGLQINNGATVTIQSGGSLNISGDVTNNGTLNNLGTITLNGTAAQSFPGGTGTVSNMNILEVNKASGAATLNRKMTISGIFKPTAGNITLTDTITIRSNAAGTASIDKVGVTTAFTYSGAGKFCVERYIPTGTTHGKGWQLLAAPTVGQTVKEAWQEGAATSGSNPKPGYGTTLTSNLAGAIGLGFDFYTPGGGPSIKVYDPATNQYNGISSTNAWSIANTRGYMVFVRGDRSVNTSAQPAIPVTLRTTGKIYARGADAPASVPVMAGKYESVGNPYASTIDFIDLRSTSTGLNQVYYVWDPTMSGSYGLGGFQTISSANGYIPTPGNTTNYPAAIPYTRIQSGQAFFVYSTTGGTVNFNESNKVSGSQQVFREGLQARARQFMRAYLYTESGVLADGNTIAFDGFYSNAFDQDDALKLGNAGENFGVMSEDGHWLAVEARKPVLRRDTIFYQVTNLKNNTSYQLRFVPDHIQSQGMQAWLVDQFTRQMMPISLSDETSLHFEVTADAASRAPDRFYVIFELMRPLPVTILEIDASRKGEQVKVDWTVAQETDISHYVVERSVNGRQFSDIGRVSATGATGYAFLDESPLSGDNFYRIRAIGLDAAVQHSRIVNVKGQAYLPDMVIYPNPSDGKNIGMVLKNQPAGAFHLSVYQQSGGLVFSKDFEFSGGTGKVRLDQGLTLSAGVYRVEMLNPEGRKTVRSLVIQ